MWQPSVARGLAVAVVAGALHYGGHAAGWQTFGLDVLAVAAGGSYWAARRSAAAARRAGRRSALEVNDDIVQGLALAQYRYEAGQPAQAHAAVVETLAAARRMMSGLLDSETGPAIRPGDLVRSAPADQTGPADDRAAADA